MAEFALNLFPVSNEIIEDLRETTFPTGILQSFPQSTFDSIVASGMPMLMFAVCKQPNFPRRFSLWSIYVSLSPKLAVEFLQHDVGTNRTNRHSEGTPSRLGEDWFCMPVGTIGPFCSLADLLDYNACPNLAVLVARLGRKNSAPMRKGVGWRRYPQAPST